MPASKRRSEATPSTVSAERLKEEIALLEIRLRQIGPEGDCGYEKAMVRFFEQQLDMRRAWLACMLRNPAASS